MASAGTTSEERLSGKQFLRRLRLLMFCTWSIPPVFGLSFILLIGVLQPTQILAILTTPLEPTYILGWLAFAVWFMPRQMRPLAEWMDGNPAVRSEAAVKAVRRFPLVFWATFLIYLAAAPASVIFSAETYADFQSTPYDWLRIELVAVIVCITVGLPIFFLMFDLFGQAMGAMRLTRPIVSIRTKVFLIGALVPLLIDTVLVQYYWTRTGFFDAETFGVWLLLAAFAVGGSLIFAQSFCRSLGPLQALADLGRPLPAASIAALQARSTDELGVLTADYRRLLEEQRLHSEILDLTNRLLRSAGGDGGTAAVLQQVVDLCHQAFNACQAFAMILDREAGELVGVIQSGSAFRPGGHFRLALGETSLAVWVFRHGQAAAVDDALADARVSERMLRQFKVRSALAAPLRLEDTVIGVIMAVTRDGPRHYSARDLTLIEALAREAAYALHTQELREARARAEAERLEHQEQFELLLNSTAEGIYGIDTNGICTFVNTACLSMLGYQGPEDLVGKSVHALIHHTYPDGRPYPVEECRVRCMTREGKPVHADDEVHWRADGTSIPVEYWSHPVYRNGELAGAVVTFVDITERRQAEEQIRSLAYFDALTGLPNRRLLMDRLEQALIASTRSQDLGALMILDLDNFKILNDTQGHDVGDRLLIEVARRLVATLRQEDTVARLGGDEYVVVLEGLGPEPTAAVNRCRLVAKKIGKAIKEPYLLSDGGHTHHTTISLGVTLFRGQDVSIDVLLKQADLALYQAKGAGRNAVRFFDPAMQAAMDARSALEVALRNSLPRGELRVFYQPQVDRDGRVRGAEALLRWLPANGPPVMPGEFIPLAEETGLILNIGLWVMRTACAQLRAWAKSPETRGLGIAINVSARQFRRPDFVGQVRDALSRSVANPSLLTLELTESAVLENLDEAVGRMRAIKALGVTLSLDDFGTGFSSLSHFKRLPLDEVKIDKSFVCDVTRDPSDAAIVRAIIAMGGTLGLQVVAEGVETEAQFAFLKACGCHRYQGYLFGQPMPIQEWGRAWNTPRPAAEVDQS